MRLTYEWWYFSDELDRKTCNKIQNLFNTKNSERAKIGETSKKVVDKEARITEVGWCNEQWLYDLVWPYMEGANKMAGWNFDIRGAESIQLAKYETGAFYNWHRDGGSDSLSAYNKPDNDFLDGRIRKLSMAILLNDDYEGGKLQFCSYGNEGFNISTPEFYKAGSIIVFPSFMDHRVSKVTKGTRYSLVVWFVGPPFK